MSLIANLTGADSDVRKRKLIGVGATLGSFLLPLLVWCLVSYVPFIWHPKVEVTVPGGVDYFQIGMLVDQAQFDEDLAERK